MLFKLSAIVYTIIMLGVIPVDESNMGMTLHFIYYLVGFYLIRIKLKKTLR